MPQLGPGHVAAWLACGADASVVGSDVHAVVTGHADAALGHSARAQMMHCLEY